MGAKEIKSINFLIDYEKIQKRLAVRIFRIFILAGNSWNINPGLERYVMVYMDIVVYLFYSCEEIESEPKLEVSER